MFRCVLAALWVTIVVAVRLTGLTNVNATALPSQLNRQIMLFGRTRHGKSYHAETLESYQQWDGKDEDGDPIVWPDLACDASHIAMSVFQSSSQSCSHTDNVIRGKSDIKDLVIYDTPGLCDKEGKSMMYLKRISQSLAKEKWSGFVFIEKYPLDVRPCAQSALEVLRKTGGGAFNAETTILVINQYPPKNELKDQDAYVTTNTACKNLHARKKPKIRFGAIKKICRKEAERAAENQIKTQFQKFYDAHLMKKNEHITEIVTSPKAFIASESGIPALLLALEKLPEPRDFPGKIEELNSKLESLVAEKHKLDEMKKASDKCLSTQKTMKSKAAQDARVAQVSLINAQMSYNEADTEVDLAAQNLLRKTMKLQHLQDSKFCCKWKRGKFTHSCRFAKVLTFGMAALARKCDWDQQHEENQFISASYQRMVNEAKADLQKWQTIRLNKKKRVDDQAGLVNDIDKTLLLGSLDCPTPADDTTYSKTKEEIDEVQGLVDSFSAVAMKSTEKSECTKGVDRCR